MRVILELGMYGLARIDRDISGYRIVSRDTAIDIMEEAWWYGIDAVDTAPGYGGGVADSMIRCCREKGINYRVCSKIGLDIKRNRFANNIKALYDDIEQLKDMHGDHVYRILLHSPSREILRDTEGCQRLFKYIKDNFGGKAQIGVSLRNPNDIVECGRLAVDEKLYIQVNYSWIDRRIQDKLVDNNFRFIARSIYGSGILEILYRSIRGEMRATHFDADDIRSGWDIDSIIERARVERVEFESICRNDPSVGLDELVAMLIEGESRIEGAIIGPTRKDELRKTIAAFSGFKRQSM